MGMQPHKAITFPYISPHSLIKTSYIPSDFKLSPWSGTFTQYWSSERRHVTTASMAFVIARSMPFSLTKKVVPYLLDKRVQNTFGRANLTPSPTLKFKTLPLPPNSSTTCEMQMFDKYECSLMSGSIILKCSVTHGTHDVELAQYRAKFPILPEDYFK